MDPQLAEQVLSGCRAIRSFALTHDMLEELVEADDGLSSDSAGLGCMGGIATVMTDLLTALPHYADTCPVNWDEVVDRANYYHRVESGVGRYWSLPPFALLGWVESGRPWLVGRECPIIAIPQNEDAVQWIIEHGGVEWPASSGRLP